MRLLFALFSAVLVLGVGGVAALGAPTPQATPSFTMPSNELAISATDDGFTIPAQVKAGRYVVTFNNGASQTIEAALMRLPDGVDAATFQASFATPTLPPWNDQVVAIGGPGETDPGDRTQVVVNLTPGQYVVTTNTDSPALTSGFEVTGPSPAAATPASSSPSGGGNVVVLHDDSITLPSDVTAGAHIWQVMNLGHQDHQFILTKVPDGTTVDAMKEAIARPPDGTPPPGGLDWGTVVGAGGLAELSPGQTAWAVLNFSPGRYAAYCLDFDANTQDTVFALEGVLGVFDVTGPAPGGTPVSTSAVTATAGANGLQAGGKATTTDDGVNVRSAPSTSAEVVTTLGNGAEVTITGSSTVADGFTWWPIETADGTTGWVAADFLRP